MTPEKRPSRIYVDAAADFPRALERLREKNPELADELERRQRDVARKVHRTPPESIRHLRFR